MLYALKHIFFQELLLIREPLTCIFWNDYDENHTKNVFYKLNVPEIAGIKKKMCVSKVTS